MKTALIVPTNRDVTNFMEAWEPYIDTWDEVYFIEDRPESRVSNTPQITSYNWGTIDDRLGDDSWIVSRRDSAIRSYGLLVAWERGCDYILMLDDDCYPSDRIDAHFDILTEGVFKFSSTIPGYRVRGIPYLNKGRIVPDINIGLWRGVPDFDSLTQLVSAEILPEYIPQLSCSTTVAARGQYLPVCGMNLSCSRRAIPLLYNPLMGKGSPYRRFDDIWGGIVAKRVCDHLGWSVSYGPPHVHHIRASDPMTNLVKESPGIPVNETFWEVIDGITLKGSDAAGCLIDIARGISNTQPPSCMCPDYWSRLSEAYRIWAELFR